MDMLQMRLLMTLLLPKRLMKKSLKKSLKDKIKNSISSLANSSFSLMKPFKPLLISFSPHPHPHTPAHSLTSSWLTSSKNDQIPHHSSKYFYSIEQTKSIC